MTDASDLDLILLYDFDPEHPESSGPRSLHATQYFTRLTQRTVSSLTVATRRGTLYDVDMRLRPSGNKGPVATQYRAFIDYQMSEAETWEHMALTRARIIAGDPTLARDVQKTIRTALTTPRDAEVLRKEVFDMRRLIASEKGEDDAWDLKLASGGLIDIEFIAQYLALRHAHTRPDILDPSIARILENVARNQLIPPDDAVVLRDAHALYGAVTQVLRLAINGKFNPETATSGVIRRIAAIAGCPDFAILARELTHTRTRVRAIFNRILK